MKKMTKKLLLAVAVITLVLTMASCNFSFGSVQTETTPAETTNPQDMTGPDGDWEAKEVFCKELRRLNEISYSKIELNVATTSNGITLNSQFVLNEKEVEYSIVGSNEANPLEGRISDQSPIGSAMIGARVGEEVTVHAPFGEYTIKILEVSRAKNA